MACKKLFLASIFVIFFVTAFASPVDLKNNSESSLQMESHVSTAALADPLYDYTGVIGTGVRHETVSATGGGVEFAPGGANYYLFFTQTLGNGIYYEGRIYTRDNYNAQNPLFPSVPASNENNPWGYGGAIKIGYDFQPTNILDIIPYVRFNAYNDMSLVYQDTNGDYINSTTYAILPGVKVAYKVTQEFNPYVELSGGWQLVQLNGGFSQSASPYSATGSVTQQVINYEIGFSSKLSENISLIPYIMYITTENSPDSVASAPYSANGFNISSLTGTQTVFGLKLSASW